MIEFRTPPRLRTMPLPDGDVLLVLDRWSGGAMAHGLNVSNFLGVTGLLIFEDEIELEVK